MPKRNCNVCGKAEEVPGGKLCEAGHFVCKACVGTVVAADLRAQCPICQKPQRTVEENKAPSELLSKWLSEYAGHAKIQTTIGGIEAEDGNSQTSCWLLFRRPDGTDVQIQFAARPSQPYATIVAKIFEGRTDDEMAARIGSWVDEQTKGAPRKRSSGVTMFHPSPEIAENSPIIDTSPIVKTNAPMAERDRLQSQRISKLIRIVAGDGQKNLELFFVRRQNDDLYYGASFDPSKYSYHASGKQHLTVKTGAHRQESKHLPLSMVEGYCHLVTLGYDLRSILNSTPGENNSIGKKSEGIVFIDARAIPKGFVNISLGILEPGKLDKVPLINEPNMLDHQVVLFTDMKPWVCVRVAWCPETVALKPPDLNQLK